ncbi:MAG: radical SAM protein [Bacillota bacterium]|nr:radical SAM protein [Bacillota bacterium]
MAIYNMVDLIKELQERNIPQTEYKKYIDRYMDLKARRDGIPLHGQLELTSLCNLDSKMCFVHMKKADVLPFSFWKKVIDQAHLLGMMDVILTGGECLTHPDFDQIYLYLLNKGIHVDIFSNGVLIDEKRVEFFKKYPPSKIQITLYGSSEDVYEKVTGKRVFSIVRNNLLRLKEAGILVELAITPNKYNVKDIQNIISLADSLCLPYEINYALSSARKETNRVVEDLSLDEYLDIYRQKEGSNVLTEKKILDIPEKRNGSSKGLLCAGGRSSFQINYQGFISPCTDLYFIKEDLNKLSFEEGWEKTKNWAKEFPIPIECQTCPYEKVCNTCAALHYDPNNPGHRNPRICERTMRFVLEGLIKI